MPEDQVIDNQIEEGIESPEPENTSVRDELKKAIEEVKEKNPESEKPVKESKARANDGKFVKQEAKKPEVKIPYKGPSQPAGGDLQSAPRAYNNASSAVKAKWAELPEEVKKELIKREIDVDVGFTKMDEERTFGKQLKEVINPYLPVIQAQGYTPQGVIQSLLNSAYILKTGSDEQKVSHLRQIAQSYGIDPAILAQNSQASTSPEIASLQRELEQFRNERHQESTQKQQQEKAVINESIRSFAADTEAHPHFEAVRPHMAALLQSNLAKDLQDAYDQAVYARPDTRSTLLESHQATSEAQRLSDAKAKAEAAKKAGSSIKGGPGAAVPNSKKADLSLREELRANLRASMQH